MRKKYDPSVYQQWAEMKAQGASLQEISEMYGAPKTTINSAIFRIRKQQCSPSKPDTTAEDTKRTPSLGDFSVREILRYLYNLGYRLDSEGLYQIEVKKNRVKLTDIINE